VSAGLSRCGVIRARRRRTPVASKTALASAAATRRIELSPAPPRGSSGRFIVALASARLAADPPIGWAVPADFLYSRFAEDAFAAGELPEERRARIARLQEPPAAFRKSARLAEQNLHACARDLVGDRNPREHEFTVQLRSFDSGKSGAQLGVAVLIALCSALLARSLKGGLAIVGGLNLGSSVELVHNPVEVMELAMEKGAAMVLLPVSCRRALVGLSNDVATKVQSLF
jgi:hypothetical protein